MSKPAAATESPLLPFSWKERESALASIANSIAGHGGGGKAGMDF